MSGAQIKRRFWTTLLYLLAMPGLVIWLPGCKRDRAEAERKAQAAGRIEPEESTAGEAEKQQPPNPDEKDESVHYHWTLQVGGAGEEQVTACDRGQNSTVLVVGSFDENVKLGDVELKSRGGDDVFVARISAEGEVLKVHHLGGPGDESAVAIREAEGGAILVGGSFEESMSLTSGDTLESNGERDGFVVRFSGDLDAVEWAISLGGAGTDEVLDLAVAGDILAVAGYSTDGFEGLAQEEGRAHGFAGRLNLASGATEWLVGVVGESSDKAESVDVGLDGKIVVSGYFKEKARVAGREIQGIGHRDIFVTAFGPDGKYRWGRAVGADGWDDVEAVHWTGDQVLVAGFSKGELPTDEGSLQLEERSAYAAVLNEDGTALWVKAFASAQPSAVKAVELDSGTAILIGEFQGELDVGGGPMKSRGGSIDVFVAGYDLKSGQYKWSSWLGGDGHESLHCGTTLASDVVVAGFFEEELDLGTTVLQAEAGHDGFVAAIRGEADLQGRH